jgi:hypothetical protein
MQDGGRESRTFLVSEQLSGYTAYSGASMLGPLSDGFQFYLVSPDYIFRNDKKDGDRL